MAPTRFPYGTALGYVNNFNYLSSTTANAIVSGDTTPDVTNGGLFYTNNTSSTVITHFDLQNYSTKAAEYEGKVVTVFFLDTATTIGNGDQVYLAGTNNLFAAGGSITLMHSRSAWYELCRGNVDRTGGITNYIAIGNTASINVDRVSTVLLSGSGITVIQGISGGYAGQMINVVGNSAGITVQMASGGNILMGTNAIVISTRNCVQFVKVGLNWVCQQAFGATGG